MLFFTLCVRMERGPVLNSSCSRCASSSGDISLLGFCIKDLKEQLQIYMIILDVRDFTTKMSVGSLRNNQSNLGWTQFVTFAKDS